MVLTLHTMSKVECKIDFDDVHSMVTLPGWIICTQINMKDGRTIKVKETADEIMEMLADGRAREGLHRSLDRIIANEFR